MLVPTRLAKRMFFQLNSKQTVCSSHRIYILLLSCLQQINWASLIVRSKFTVFALFYFVFEGNFLSTSPRGAGLILEGLILGGAYFRNFTVYVYQSTVEAVVVHVAWQCKIDMRCNRTITRNAQFKISNDDPILSIL